MFLFQQGKFSHSNCKKLKDLANNINKNDIDKKATKRDKETLITDTNTKIMGTRKNEDRKS